MKKFKKIMAVLVAAIMVVAMTVPAFAAAAQDCSITVTPNYKGHTYTLYKLFDATTVPGRTDGQAGIAYTLMSGKDNLVSSGGKTGATWFDVDAQGNVTLGTTPTDYNDTFRAWAEEYGTKIGSDLTASADNDATIKWTNLAEGYYFVSTTTGALLTLDSVKPNMTVEDKNTVVTYDKTITGVTTAAGVSDPDGVDTNKKNAHAEIGGVVTYSIPIQAYRGTENLVLSDKLDAGLTLQAKTNLTITSTNPLKTLEEDIDYTVDKYQENAKGGEIKITFTNAFLQALEGTASTPSVITVGYTALVNEDAAAGATGHPNTPDLKYGHTPHTAVVPTIPKVYTAEITVNKFEGDNASDPTKKIEGVKFVLTNADGQYYKFDSGTKKVTWTTVATNGDLTNYKLITSDTGEIKIEGLIDGTYTLTETDPLDGYKKVAPVTITIANKDFTDSNLKQTADVKNEKGAELPSTGGMGTTVLYIVGGMLIVLAGAYLFFSRKKTA